MEPGTGKSQQRSAAWVERSDLKAGDKISFKGFGGRVVLTRSVADAITLADGRPFTGAAGTPTR